MRQQIPAIARVGYEPGYGRSVRIAEFDRPMMSDDVETAQTVAYMEELASFDAGERSVIEATHRALAEAGLDMSAAPIDKARAIFWFLKRTIRYVPTPATGPLVDQTLVAPSALLAMPDPNGDCPQFSMLAQSMFRICCVPCYIKTIAAEPSFPSIFSHVYNVVEVSPGQFMPFDSSNGPAPGAEFARPFKQRVWPHTIPDACSDRQRKGKVLMMRSQPRGGGNHGYRNSTLRGVMGDLQCDQDLNCFDSSGNSVTMNVGGSVVSVDPSSTGDDLVLPGQTIPSPFGTSAPAASSSSSSSFFSTLANDLTSIASPIVKAATAQKPYYITNAAGQQVLYNPATGQVVSSVGAALSNPVVLIGLGLVVAALAFKK